ncbi:phosphoenolpyruvate carboxykinase, partial [Nocardioides humilatus]
MVDVERVLDEAGLTNTYVRDYVARWAGITGADNVEVVTASEDARQIELALATGELLPAGEGSYYSRSYFKDTARAEERTIV